MSTEVTVIESSGATLVAGLYSDPSIQLTLVNSAVSNISTNDPPSLDPVAKSNSETTNLTNDLPNQHSTGVNPPSAVKDIKNVCLVCLQPLQSYPPSSKGSGPSLISNESPGYDESTSCLSNESFPSSERNLSLTLLDFCQLLKVNVPPGITRHALWTFCTPLCEKCVEDVVKIRALHRQIAELELSLTAARNSVKDKVVRHNIRQEVCDTSGEEEVNPLTGIVCAVKKIRSYIKKDVSESVSNKKRGRKPAKKGRHTLEAAEMTPAILKECVSRKSSFGRVVKRPRYFISDDENGDGDDVEKKFDPSGALSHTNVPGDKGGGIIGIIKVEASGSSGKQGGKTDSNEVTVSQVESKAEGGDTKVHEVELLQGHTSDGNWSDGIEQVFDDEDGESSRTKISKRSRLKKITKRKNLLAASASAILNKRKKAVGNLKKGKLTGINGEPGNKTGDGTLVHEQMSNEIEEIKVETKMENEESLKVKCDKCPRTFSDVVRKERHMLKIHQGIKRTYECKGCDKKFSKLKELSHHRKVEHPPKEPKVDASGRKLFQCDICKVVFKNFADLQIHHRLHTGEKPFKCSIDTCKEAFISKGRYEVHVEVKHPGKAPLKCEFCPRSFFRHHRLRDHKKSHTGEKPYLCEICSKAFTQPAYLKYHQTKHKELNLAEFKCDQCDKKFASPINLKYHRETQHQKKYRYHCDICGHGATHKSHMRLHMRRHTGERPHTCSLCQKTFTRGAQLKIHIRSHTGERPYSCTMCTKGFTNSSKLRRHELTHAENKSKRRQNIVKVTHLSGGDHQQNFPQSSSTLSTTSLAGASNGILLPADVVDVQVDEDNNGQAVLKLEHVPTSLNEQEFQQQLITIQQPNGVTYQIIASEDAINNETFAEYILINGDFTLG